jgi:hypothetical protein
MSDITNTRDPFMRTPPGSPQALKRGCICFAAENRFGSGRWEPGSKHPIYIADTECPLHGIHAVLELMGIN